VEAARALGSALARTALAGNPSDGYGGAVLSTTVADFTAEVETRASRGLEVEPQSRLVRACVQRFADSFEPGALSVAVRWRTSIPRGLGLGGSSAIAIATLRSLCRLHRVTLGAAQLAEMATTVEREDLGIPGGRQDQVVQAHEGLLLMDFADGRYDALDVALLPPLLIALSFDAAQPSGVAHATLRALFAGGDPDALAGIKELAALAREARQALTERRAETFAGCVDRSFDVRARMMPLEPRQLSMVATARELGLSANFTGSGGAIVCVCRDREQQTQAQRVLRGHGYRVLAPQLGPRRPPA
jgi:glucuronokinase